MRFLRSILRRFRTWRVSRSLGAYQVRRERLVRLGNTISKVPFTAWKAEVNGRLISATSIDELEAKAKIARNLPPKAEKKVRKRVDVPLQW